MGHPSIGLGFDAHRFDPTGERPLWLACLSWNDGTPACWAILTAMPPPMP